MFRRICALPACFGASCLVASFVSSPAAAANFYWDGGSSDIAGNGNSTSAGGAGTWNTSLMNWDSGASPHLPWNNAANHTAIFAGTAGAIDVAAPITVGAVTLTTNGYTFSGSLVEIANGGLFKGPANGNHNFAGFALATGNTTYRFESTSTSTGGFSNGNIFTMSGSITDAGKSVVISGNQPVYLTGTNSYGTTTVNAGAALGFSTATVTGLGVGSISAGANSSILRTGGNLNNSFLQRLAPTTNVLTIYANNASSGNALDLSGTNGGTYLPNASLATWDNAGTQTFAFTGTITPANGTYRFGGPKAGNYINLNNTNTLTGSNALVVSEGSISKLRINSANNFTGSTLVNSGTLYLSDNLALQNSAIETSGAGNIDLSGVRPPSQASTPVTTPTFGGLTGNKNITAVFNSTYFAVTRLTLNPGTGNAHTYSGVIADGAANMSLVKSGAGSQSLDGFNTYTGPTTVNGGTLLLNGSLDAASTVTVNSGVLAGTGFINGSVIVQPGGTISPGNPDGTLSAESVAISGTLAVELGDVEPGTGPMLAVDADLNLTGSTLNLSVTGETIQSEYLIATYGSLSGTFTTVNGLPPGWGIDYTYNTGNAIAIVPPAPVAPPAQPAGLTATSGISPDGSTSFITLNWNASSGAAGYLIKRSSVSGGPYAQIGTTTLRTFNDTAVTVGQTYYYVVSAQNSSGESMNSSQADAAPIAPPPPAKPAGLTASDYNGLVSLVWNATSATTGYVVKRGTTSGGPYSQVGTTSTPAYLDTAGVVGITYYYVVASVNSGGTSADSDETSALFSGDPILAAVDQLKGHITGTAPLSAAQIEQASLALQAQINRFAESASTISAVLSLVSTYDSIKGPLWLSTSTGGLTRSAQTNDLTWTIYRTMQGIMDKIYNAQTLASQETLLKPFKFGSSSNFPGACAPPANPSQTHTAVISASYLNTFGRATQGDGPNSFARKPTGCYLAPGTLATITVPPPLVGAGYMIRVGCHSWDFSNKPTIKRLDRSTLLYPINSAQTKIASPLGGGIYIEVPFLANAGVVNIDITGAVRSPYFSAKGIQTTTPTQWLTERANPAPWADFQSDKFMMQVPTSWISAMPDPTQLMANWDTAMDAINDLMGFPHIRGKETMYPQVDLLLRASVYAPGYPSVNLTYSPTGNYGGYANSHLIRGPQFAPDYEFHEQGHAFFFPKFAGETESAVNLLHAAVWNQKFGFSLDDAFRKSRSGYAAYCTLDTTAMAWMCVFNFAPRKVPMADAEKAYQLKGHAKFVDIARLYGWNGLGAFWYSYNLDEENGINTARDNDGMLLRLCKSVGKDIRPLFHFWGIYPQNPSALAAAVAAEGLQPPVEIYDTLVHYKSLVPANNAAFRTFAQSWWGKQPSINGYWEEREHARQWDTTALYGVGDQQRSEATNPGEIYNENSSSDITARVQELIDLYYPNGRPENDYVIWAAAYPASDLTNSNADLDGDGMSNDEERIFGLNPTRGASSNPISIPLNASAGTFSYTRRTRSLTGTNYEVWTSPDLKTWAVDSGATQNAGTPVTEVETVSVTLSPTLLTSPRLFVQIRASK